MAASTGLIPARARAWASWLPLAGLLVALLGGAATFDRRSWPGLLGDEATYLVQAYSLAWDLDFRYAEEDYLRFERIWERPPEGLILQSADGGASITYGKPFYYAAWLAPFVRMAPVRGVAIANVALLALAAVAAARGLTPVLGRRAPLWVTVFVFASVMFAHVWWAHADLFLACLVAVSMSLIYGADAPEPRRKRELARWVVAGALLVVPVLSRPFYGALLLPAILAVPRDARGRRSLLLGAGFVVAVGFSIAGSLVVRDTWTSYGATRMGFYSYTGFPAVDFPAEDWTSELAERPGTGAWVGEGKLRYHVSPRLLAYDLVYFLAGRHVGILPYFLPLLLGLATFRRGRGRSALLVAVALAVAGFFYVRAFNFYGGGGALGNRYFLPLYPALWFLAGRRLRLGWVLAVAVAAAPFLWPLWTHPRAHPLERGGEMGYVSDFARSVLPYETSLSHLKPAGREDVVHGELWVKLLASEPVPLDEGESFLLAPDRRGELLVGSDRPLEALIFETEPPAPVGLRLGGAKPGSPEVRDGRIRYPLSTGRPTARHRMWWTFDDVWLYRIEIAHEGAEPMRFRFVRER